MKAKRRILSAVKEVAESHSIIVVLERSPPDEYGRFKRSNSEVEKLPEGFWLKVSKKYKERVILYKVPQTLKARNDSMRTRWNCLIRKKTSFH